MVIEYTRPGYQISSLPGKAQERLLNRQQAFSKPSLVNLISSLPGKASRMLVELVISKDANLAPELQCLLRVKEDSS